MAEIDDPADECLSVANTFIAAGAPAAVGTAWAANDFTSALWTVRFLGEVRTSADYLGAACSASRWIKNATPAERRSLIECSIHQSPAAGFDGLDDDYGHPYFWGNHRFSGASLREC